MFFGSIESEEEMKDHFIDVIPVGGPPSNCHKRAELDLTDTNEFILHVDSRTYRFRIHEDSKLGIHLMNGVDLKVTNPPAFSYPSPYIVLG